MIRVSCPKCKAILQVEDKHAGQVIACSNCKTSLRLPPAPPAPPIPPPVVSASSTPTPTAITAPPIAKDNPPTPKGTGVSSLPEQSKAIAAKLKTAWQSTKTPIKAAIIGGTSVVVLSCFLCCGIFGINIFRRSPGGAAQNPANIAKLDFSKGPNGEEVAKVEEAKRVFFAFKDKAKGKVRHGLFAEFFDKEKTKKKVEGNFFAGEWHGTVARWYESGEKRNERFYDRGKGVGTHKGFKKDGSLAWDLSFDADGLPLMSKAPVEAFVNQWADFVGIDKWGQYKSEAAAWHMERGNLGSREPPVPMPVTIYRMSQTIEAKHSVVVRLFGAPKNIFAKITKSSSGHYVYVYQCQDTYVRLRVDSIPFDFSKLPQSNDKVIVLTEIFTGGDQDF
jgi:hypothetical protein